MQAHSLFMTRSSIIIILLLVGHTTIAQLTDGGAWLSLSFEKNLKGPYTLKLTPEIRMDQGITRAGSILVDGAFSYKASKWLKATAVVRQQWRQELDGYFALRQRYNIDLVADKSWNKIKFYYRLRYQQGISIVSDELNPGMRQAIRHKIKAKRKLIKKTWLSVGYEFFYSRGDGGFDWTDGRFKLEIERKIKKRRYLTVGYLFQNEWNAQYPLSEHVIVLNYSLGFK